MTKRRLLWLGITWVDTTLLVVVWITAQTEDVSAGNALLVGLVAATALTAAVAGIKRK